MGESRNLIMKGRHIAYVSIIAHQQSEGKDAEDRGEDDEKEEQSSVH